MEENNTQWNDQVAAWNKAYKRKKKIIILSILGVILAAALAVAFYIFVLPMIQAEQSKADSYKLGLQLLEAGKSDEAADAFWKAGDYKDAEKYSGELNYDRAEKLLAEGKVTYAAIAFGKAGNYKDAHDRSFELWARFADRKVRDSLAPVAVAWINPDGTVGVNATLVNPGDSSHFTNIVSIALNYYFTIGTRQDGTVVCAGDQNVPQLDWTDIIVATTAGSSHIVGLKSDGTVKVHCIEHSGNNCVVAKNVAQWTDVISVCGGSYVPIVGLRADGTLLAVADGETQFPDPTLSDMVDTLLALENVVAVRESGPCLKVLRADGLMYAFGFTDPVFPFDELVQEFFYDNPEKSVWFPDNLITLEEPIRDRQLIAAVFPDRSADYYAQATSYLSQSEIAKAAIAFGKAGNYKDAPQRSMELWNQITRRKIIAIDSKTVAALCNDGSVAFVEKYGNSVIINTDKQFVSIGPNYGITAAGEVVPFRDKDAALFAITEGKQIVDVYCDNEGYYFLQADGTLLTQMKATADNPNANDLAAYLMPTYDVVQYSHGILWHADGRIEYTGDYGRDNPEVDFMTDVVEVVCLWVNAIGLKQDGTLTFATPALIPDPNDFGAEEWFNQLVEDFSQWTDLVDIESAQSTVVGLTADGRVLIYPNHLIQFNETDIVEIAVSDDNAVIGLKKDGTLVYAGDNDYFKEAVAKMSGLMVPQR